MCLNFPVNKFTSPNFGLMVILLNIFFRLSESHILTQRDRKFSFWNWGTLCDWPAVYWSRMVVMVTPHLSVSGPFLAMIIFSLPSPPTGALSVPVVNCRKRRFCSSLKECNVSQNSLQETNPEAVITAWNQQLEKNSSPAGSYHILHVYGLSPLNQM